jgi:membrane protease YdiL (CAAX protease family)
MRNKSVGSFFIISPILLLILTQLTAILLGQRLGVMVYIPIILLYWIAMTVILYKFGFINIKRWLARPHGHWIWYVLAGLVGLSSLPFFVQYSGVLRNVSVLIPTIVFFLINPWVEEFYWRGLLLDVTNNWPGWVSLLYSSLLFTAFHSAFVWQSEATRNLPFYIAVFVL